MCSPVQELLKFRLAVLAKPQAPGSQRPRTRHPTTDPTIE
jgi:hypothetical protein